MWAIVSLWSIILEQHRVLGISSVGLCQLLTAVIFHRPCAHSLSEAWHEENEMGKRSEGEQDFHQPLRHICLFVAVDLSRSESPSVQLRRGSNIRISVEACESSPIPCPHPSTLTCVSLTMETFSLGVGGGLELWQKKKKKKHNYSLLPWLCHYWKLTPALNSTLVAFADQLVDRAAGTWSQSSTMAAKNTAKAGACAAQTSTGTTRPGWALNKKKNVSMLAGNFETLVVWLQQGWVSVFS